MKTRRDPHPWCESVFLCAFSHCRVGFIMVVFSCIKIRHAFTAGCPASQKRLSAPFIFLSPSSFFPVFAICLCEITPFQISNELSEPTYIFHLLFFLWISFTHYSQAGHKKPFRSTGGLNDGLRHFQFPKWTAIRLWAPIPQKLLNSCCVNETLLLGNEFQNNRSTLHATKSL